MFVEQELRDRQTNRDLGLLLAYPFNTVQRVELNLGFSNISFDRELITRTFDPFTGNFLGETKDNLGSPSDINIGQASAALVYDNSFFGATGPILGQRYRLEASPTIGSLQMINALADVRKYFMPVRPFTLAFRALHYGRYGKDGQDPRLSPLFLGYDGLVRGYRASSFDVAECRAIISDPNACPVFDQLLGSRMLVGNAELRFPLLGVLGLGSGYYGALPLDFGFFGDAGVAWNKGESPKLFGGDRQTVYSAGFTTRLNLFGYFVMELDLAHPFQRPGKGWVWQFSLLPGF